MEIVKIKTVKLAPNTGQVEGLPKNPRQWTKGDIDRLARSLEDTPELFEARPCLVYPQGGQFVILGGNMRYEAAKRNGAKEVPCIVFPESTPAEKLREIVIKDNGAFGSWDFDDLANEWDDGNLTEWGVPVWEAPKTQELGAGTGEVTIEGEAEIYLKVRCEDIEDRMRLKEDLESQGYECSII